jgi:hypothetical protein
MVDGRGDATSVWYRVARVLTSLSRPAPDATPENPETTASGETE